MAYTAINIEGGMFPPDLLDEIAIGEGVQGQKGTDFGVSASRRITDEIQSSFSDSRVFWDAFQRRLIRASQNSTTITRQNWMAPLLGDVLGFDQLRVQQGSAEAGGQSYFLSHRQGEHTNATPVHIVSIESDLDHRNGARRSPHALMQEYLNRSDALWGLVSNGKTIRLLRDSARLSKPTFIEFDLGGMVESNLYNEFSLFYRLTHATRFPRDPEKPQECLLEDYYQQGIDQGTRIRDKLRLGVENALRILGNSFISHPESKELRAKIDSGALGTQQFYRQLLRLIYRLLFLMVSEERKLLFPDTASVGSRYSIYSDYYSIEQLRRRADRYFHGDDHTDLWQGLNQTFRLFRTDDIATSLGLSALNGELFGERACSDLEGATCTNNELLRAVRELSVFRNEKDIPTRVNYAGLDVEELGSVYEGLLEFQPVLKSSPASFELAIGSERKETGSYYTPPDLVHELIKSALVPVIEDKVSKAKDKETKEKAILDLRVCDPASGSGHFMLAAARRLARELAIVREGESEPTPTVYREALRDVIRSCIYAVDKNPLAVDLCKVALWIEGHNPGLPLSFLDNHIKCGDSLVGVLDLGVLDEGIPDGAYKPVEGDDKGAGTAYRKQNERERKSQRQLALGESEETVVVGTSIAEDFRTLGDIAEGTAEDVNAKEELYNDLRAEGSEWWKLKIACDLWTSAFFTPLLQQEDAFHLEGVPTTGTLRSYLKTGELNSNLMLEAEKTSEAQSFFHWKLEFPDVFENGGFDAVLGNPPWEQLQPEEVDFFAVHDARISKLTAARRKSAIDELPLTKPDLARLWSETKWKDESTNRFAQGSRRFELSAHGRLNKYALFTEQFTKILSETGSVGILVPSGIATDITNQYLFRYFVENDLIVSFYDFENRNKMFPAVDSRVKFCLLTLGSRAHSRAGVFAFFLHETHQIYDRNRLFQLNQKDFELFNPTTLTCPIFRQSRDKDIIQRIYETTPVLLNEGLGERGNPYNITIRRNFNMGIPGVINLCRSDSSTVDGQKMMPMIEAKMVHQFDHRWSTYEAVASIYSADNQKSDPEFLTVPRYWMPESYVEDSLSKLSSSGWIIVWRDITNNTNERTVIAGVVPRVPTDFTLRIGFLQNQNAILAATLVSNFNSFAFDFTARQKIGGTHLSDYVVKQLPVITPDDYDNPCQYQADVSNAIWIRSRVLELTYTAWDLNPFAKDLGYEGPPFRWDPDRRFLLRCELDAAFFHLYGIERDDVDYIMETFPIVKGNDERDHGEYRTKRVILEIYDEIAKAIETGQPYQTRLDPPPADPRVAHTMTAPV